MTTVHYYFLRFFYLRPQIRARRLRRELGRLNLAGEAIRHARSYRNIS
ncbi:MAG: hypothetical protein QOJ94_1156 [Sphingomonadales bacterium]|jgi:hypothetical protein|nr:hypothetical protein [Sphingomonadales bacterium]